MTFLSDYTFLQVFYDLEDMIHISSMRNLAKFTTFSSLRALLEYLMQE